MHAEDVQHYTTLLKTYQLLMGDCVRVRGNVIDATKGLDLEALADMNLVLKRAEQICDHMRKAYKQLRQLSEQTTCALWVKQETGDPVRTDYVTSTPEVKMVPKVPSKKENHEEYVAFMKALGAPDEAIEHEVFKLSWPGLVEYTTERGRQGLPIPEGHEGQTYNVYTTRLRQKRAITDDDLEQRVWEGREDADVEAAGDNELPF